ncbi:MAG TPA: M28 family peptidase [Steroidobacteraceae bacterium]|nr:M28 family peptidase [Steroidobacteraceae bacterium]
MKSWLICALVLASGVAWGAGASLALPEGTDADTRDWWAKTAVLADVGMEGRDTGSAGYARAADYVTGQLKAAGLEPAGEHGGWRQTVPLTEARIETEGTSINVLRTRSASVRFQFLYEIVVRATDALPAEIDAPLAFRGYCSKAELGPEMKGKVAVCFGTRRAGLPTAAERISAAEAAGAAAIVVVDDPGFTIEPARWPAAYARTVRIEGDPPVPAPALAVFNLSSAGFVKLLAGTGLDAAGVLEAGAAKRPLRGFPIPGRFSARLHRTQRRYTSDNVLALLPGTDPKLAREVLVVSAHLDGYGYGAAVDGDTLYKGAFDDAAYVSTLIRLAERRRAHGFRRSVLFAAFTGEEKGLLGSTWFVRHPSVPRERLIADINLDMIRPLFPLKALTMLAMSDSSLAAAARAVGAPRHIEIRADAEPERGLLHRADHWPFLEAGIPATTFVFAYDPNTQAERRYREWYRLRYHRPQDDMSQPIDIAAAADFNRFFYALAEEVADSEAAPVLERSP